MIIGLVWKRGIYKEENLMAAAGDVAETLMSNDSPLTISVNDESVQLLV